MGTFDDFLVESPLVQAEMDRLRELHGTLEKALELAVREARERAGKRCLPRDVRRHMERKITDAVHALV